MDIAELLKNCQNLDRSELKKLLANAPAIQGATFSGGLICSPFPVAILTWLCDILARRYPKLPWTLIKGTLTLLELCPFSAMGLVDEATVHRLVQASAGSEVDAPSGGKAETAKAERN
ncbi:MAG: hypothetical protein H5U08_12580 [Thermogutta sp.]|uniref:hypothetical protein n=1 Tax=Thermogutta sp. TaxID=1962930 RepID=UPI0019C33EC0|nr:hypothetical protein [Thermogutta sp.]MBC7353189.1 hypothetical protein [Thermogutta sp.]